jgi:hypothetical protein
MAEADPGSRLQTIRAMVQYQLRQTQTDTIRECLKRALTALNLAVAAEREGPQVARRASNEGGFPRT